MSIRKVIYIKIICIAACKFSGIFLSENMKFSKNIQNCPWGGGTNSLSEIYCYKSFSTLQYNAYEKNKTVLSAPMQVITYFY